MKKTKNKLSKLIARYSVGFSIIGISIISIIILYFFLMNNIDYSKQYALASLEKNAHEIEKTNSKYCYFLDGVLGTIEQFIKDLDENKSLDKDKTTAFLKSILDKDPAIKASFLMVNTLKNSNNYTDSIYWTPYVDRTAISNMNKNFKNYSYFKYPTEKGVIYISNPFTVGNGKITIYRITLPIKVKDKIYGAMGIDVYMDYVYNSIKNVSMIDGRASIALINNRGTYLWHNHNQDLVDKKISLDCKDPELRLKRLKHADIDEWIQSDTVSLCFPIKFNENQAPWQLQSRVNIKYIFSDFITALCWIIPILIIFIITISFLIRRLINKHLKPITTLTNISEQLAQGDLTEDINIKSDNEIGTLAHSFNTLVIKLRSFVSEVQINTENVTIASHQLENSSDLLSTSSNEQAGMSEEISSNMEEMSSSVQTNAEKSRLIKNNNEHMMSQLENLNKKAQIGGEKSNEVLKLIHTINDIAENIKILSLNAAVESAKAGEHGKGFAVVAAEIKRLSENTSKSVDEITKKIKENVEISMDTTNTLTKELLPDIKTLADNINEIAFSTNEQANNIEQVNHAIQAFNENAQSNAASAEELSATSKNLGNQAERLNKMVKTYKIK